MLIARPVAEIFFPQRVALGLDARESTPGFKRQLIILGVETRSFDRAAKVCEGVLGFKVDDNTIGRLCHEAGEDLSAAKHTDWKAVLPGEVPVPEVAIVESDGGRVRTRKTDCGPGVHLDGNGWNESKNAIMVSATSTVSEVDPQPQPPECFLDCEHVAKLAEMGKVSERAEKQADSASDEPDAQEPQPEPTAKPKQPSHKPKRILRSVVSSMKSSKQFGKQMVREAKRRKFFESSRKAFVGDGLACNWKIHATHFGDFTPILDFTHAVTYLFEASVICYGKSEEAWSTYTRWMTATWQGRVREVIDELQEQQQRIGLPPEKVSADDPRERMRCVIQYLENNASRMRYDKYRCQGLPTTSAWMESTVKEMNYRVKGTEMFWNNPEGAESILQLRAAALCDDDRLARFLTYRPGSPYVRRVSTTPVLAV